MLQHQIRREDRIRVMVQGEETDLHITDGVRDDIARNHHGNRIKKHVSIETQYTGTSWSVMIKALFGRFMTVFIMVSTLLLIFAVGVGIYLSETSTPRHPS